MIETLKLFTSGKSLFEATSGLLAKLNIEFDRETAKPIEVADLYDGPMPTYLKETLQSIQTYFIGIINDLSLAGGKSNDSLDEITETIRRGGKYDGMFVFACDAKKEATLTRTQSSALTRAFNRIASANPVILVIRQGNLLSLATCERMEYSQDWRKGSGEKLGKVSILRNIDCDKPHRGHVDILLSLGDKPYPTFEELYKHWMEVFSNELLTKKFYNELSDWYAWAVQIVKFPNHLDSNEDDAKYNHESCIRLITRLIFVWFLKQKHLIPEEFFDETYIRENLIENFNPHDKQNLLYNTEQSKYYRLILQNLFFAMLNCPIVAEGKTTPNNRRFRGDGQKGFVRDGYNVNNLMRYKKEFAENGGADKFMKLANRSVPFLNGGLFDCLDDKPKKLYYDGFSEREESLEQLFFPDYLFFGEEVGKGIDLSQWYDDKKKKNVSARGIIDILKRYSFTIEENTPYDQEVSLDPELLGKVFENLLAAYNPETKQTARKQTGSFYTPREIVQYMVDESLVAHLKRMCGEDKEAQYRSLLSYATDDVQLSEDERKSIMKAIYNCRVLDPACGSGAFPMGVLQQMVHVLKRIDPENEMWYSMMVDIAIQDAKKELEKVVSGDAAEKAKIEDNRQARLADIENAFNQSVNDPDYARKLYLIEHCIYGVDIQPIATQISKLRFFISLVVDQKPTKDAKSNFGIRPLPNLEAKFVTANTLIPLDRTQNLFTSIPVIRDYEERLQEINHRIFTAKKNTIKIELQERMLSTRMAMAQSMENLGAIGPNGYNQLIGWNPFDQNASASFFDPEWMFGVKGGFDVVIGNPPYGAKLTNAEKSIYRNLYPETQFKIDTYSLFVLKSMGLLAHQAMCSFIIPNTLLDNKFEEQVRVKLLEKNRVVEINDLNDKVFDDVVVHAMILLFANDKREEYTVKVNISDSLFGETLQIPKSYFCEQDYHMISVRSYGDKDFMDKLSENSVCLSEVLDVRQAIKSGNDKLYISQIQENTNYKPILRGKDIDRYVIKSPNLYLNYGSHLACPRKPEIFEQPKILIREAGARITATYDNENYYIMSSLYNAILVDESFDLKYLLGLLNSKLMQYVMNKLTFEKTKGAFTKAKIYHYYNLPIKKTAKQDRISKIVNEILEQKLHDSKINVAPLEDEIDHILYHLYNLTYDEVLLVDPSTPITREEYDNFKLD